MKKQLIGLGIAALMFGGVVSAGASIIVDGSIYNIDGDNDGVADDLLISQIFFDVTAGTELFIDSLVWESTGVDITGDGEITGFDNYMRLFQGNTFLTSNDDSGATFADGSVHRYDSAITYTFATAGTYMITTGQLFYSTTEALLGYDPNRAFRDYTRQNQDHGDWRLTFNVLAGEVSNVTGSDPVPEPATMLLFGTGLVGLVGSRLLKKKQQVSA